MVVAEVLYLLICQVTCVSVWPHVWACDHTCERVTAGVLTHVIEVLPESLHPPVRFLSTVGGQRVRDFLTTILVTDTNVLSFTLRVFLWSTYSGLLQ